MPKFILIDQSIEHVGGHHYEYAIRVLEAATRAGYETVLATNRRFSGSVTASLQVHAVYRYNFWLSGTEPRAARLLRAWSTTVRRWAFLLKCELVFSPLGELWANHHTPFIFLRRAQSSGLLVITPLLVGFYLFTVLRAGLQLFKAAIPFRNYIKDLAKEFRAFVSAVVRPVTFAFRPSEPVLRWLARQRKQQAFGEDTLRLFRRVPLQEGDIVFIPTLDESEMLGLLDYFRRDSRAKQASWHLLFRRNLYPGRDPEYGKHDEDLRSVRNAFRHFQQNLTGQTVRFYTDTEQLTTQYKRLGVGQFYTLPIPVSDDYQTPLQARMPEGPLKITYIGDARMEKGFHFLPGLVQDLWLKYVETGRVKFMFQSNYNTHPGEPAAVVARNQLECYPSTVVQLITKPLSTEAYRDLVLNSDLILVLYDRDNYYARSSGVFAEALVVGRPVVVPAGTWMAMQLEPFICQYHRHILGETAIVQTLSNEQLRWCMTDPWKTMQNINEKLIVKGAIELTARLTPPATANYLLISFRQGQTSPGQFVQISCQQLDYAEQSVEQRTVIVGGGFHLSSALIPLQPEVKHLWLRLSNAYSTAPVEICDLRIDYLRASRLLAVSAGGMIYSSPEEISSAVCQIIDNFSHYRASAQALSAIWATYHNPTCLVEHLAHYAKHEQPAAKPGLAQPVPNRSAKFQVSQ